MCGGPLRSVKGAARTACAGCAALALVLAACCSCTGSPSSSSPGGARSSGPQFSLIQVNNKFKAMSALRPLAARGTGSIAVILPNDATAPHFKKFDAKYLKEAFQRAGLEPSRYPVQLPQGSDQFSAAQEAITKGARVLILDARYSGAGVRIESYAEKHGVKVIDYDWLTLGGSRDYYVGFDSLKIGVLLGQGLVNCVSAWRVRHPHLIVMSGGSNDYNSAIYAQGYDAILARKFAAGWKDVRNPPGTWDPHVALSEFQHQYGAHKHKHVNAALIPNDENGRRIIRYLQRKGIKARKFPATGLDATVHALKNILGDYQCGTVYKPPYLEAQAAAALAMYVRAGLTPPDTLVNWNMTDPQSGEPVRSVLLTPEWVTADNMKATVIADKFVSPFDLCTRRYASACAAAHISR